MRRATIMKPKQGYHGSFANLKNTTDIVQAAGMERKTVDKMEFGFRQDIEGVLGSEELIIHFTDGSIMSIDQAQM